MKIVFDTNVILSAILTQGLSSRVLDLCIDEHELFISSWIIDEVSDKLQNKFQFSDNDHKSVLAFLQNVFMFATPTGKIPDACSDKDDNNILHLAEYVQGDLIITGDKDLLSLKLYREIIIIKPRQFMERFYQD